MATSTDLRAAIEEVQLSLPQAEAFDPRAFDEKKSLEKLAERIGALPWWVISSGVHAVIFLLATLLAATAITGPTEITEIQACFTPPPKPIFDPPTRRRPDMVTSALKIEGDEKVVNPVYTPEPTRELEPSTTDNSMDDDSRRGEPDKLSEIPLGGTGIASGMGVSSGGLSGAFGYRNRGGRRRAVGRFGGSDLTENSVEMALKWLKRHQEPDGHWQANKWEATQNTERVNISMTGFALLAFLGAGYTDKSPVYGDTVRRAQLWLVEAQKRGSARTREKGRFDACMYTQGIATLALAEAFGMSEPVNPVLRSAAQDAADVIVKAQGPYEGWNYSAKKAEGRNDTSVTGWNLMALKSAKISGLNVDLTAFQGCMRWLDAATDPRTGRCAYAGTVDGVTRGSGSNAMWAAGMLMRQFMGTDRGAPIMGAAADSIVKHPPKWEKGKADGVNFYYWYYGTLCMFQHGGQHWNGWNEAMKKALLDNQRTDGPLDGTAQDVHGSWDPVGAGGIPHGGRVFSTALGALCLEVYYRYLPVYGRDQ